MASFGYDCSHISPGYFDTSIYFFSEYAGNVNRTCPNGLSIYSKKAIFNKLLIIKWLDIIFVVNIQYLVLSSLIFQNLKEKNSFI